MTIAGEGELAEIERIAGDFLRNASPAERRQLLRKIAREGQSGQRSRIAAQRNPDGTHFAPRKKKKGGKEGTHPLYFLYPKGDPQPKLVILGSWVRQGPRLVGFDAVSRQQKTYLWDRIARFLPPDPKRPPGGGRLRRKGTIKRKAMFRKLRQARYLKAGSTADEAWIGFSGRAADIARTHQEGLEDAPHKGGKRVRYPRRELLGLTEADRRAMLDTLFEHFARA